MRPMTVTSSTTGTDAEFRLKLEQSILGACLLENGYPSVANIIVPETFSTKTPVDHSEIFRAIATLYPNRPIDVLSVWNEMKRTQGLGYYLAYCASLVSSASHLRYHGFILLQLTMRDALLSLVDHAVQSTQNTMSKAALFEIREEAVALNHDIIDIYENAVSFLQDVNADDAVIGSIRELKCALEVRISKIKQQSQIDSLMQNLARLPDQAATGYQRLCLSKLADLTKESLITPGPAVRLNKLLEL